MFKTSELYLANLNATEDLVINQGGTSSGAYPLFRNREGR